MRSITQQRQNVGDEKKRETGKSAFGYSKVAKTFSMTPSTEITQVTYLYERTKNSDIGHTLGRQIRRRAPKGEDI